MKKPLSLCITLALGCATLPIHLAHSQSTGPTNEFWWPNRISLEPLRHNAASHDPRGADFNYAEAFATLDQDALMRDLEELMTTSQDWWPADYGHYGPFFIRLSWHAAGTYRAIDGRGGADGGMQRFAPENSWPDNANLDKAQRLLWPIKEKYGDAISWADLIALAGNAGMESMGFNTLGFAFGRDDAWQSEETYWGPEGEWLGSERFDPQTGELQAPLSSTQMGLIYVNPEGPGGNPDPLLAAEHIRITFGRMGMNDEETAALIAGGHTFGKTHGAANPADCVGAEPEAAGIEQQGLGWQNTCGTGRGSDTITSGLEGAWTVAPAQWTHNFLQNLYGFEWEQTRSPAGAIQWIPADAQAANLVPDAHDPTLRHAPIMLTTDLSLREDPIYREITQRWLNNPDEFADAFARAWFKLMHRDMGPPSRYLGSSVPDQTFVWQDPVPAVDHQLVNARDITQLKSAILNTGLSTGELVRTAWASASSYRSTDRRGGANGARIRLSPQRDWPVNEPAELERVLSVLEGVQRDFNDSQRGNRRISLADVIVLGGAAAIEQAARRAGHDVTVPFTPGRTDASQEQTDIESFSWLEPSADGFRNFVAANNSRAPVESLIERANLLELTVPEMTVLIGGLRVLNANHGGSEDGVLTNRPGTLTNDFFMNLIDMSTVWSQSGRGEGVYDGRDRDTGMLKWQATPVDLIFGSNSELRAVSEHYATANAQARFVNDFVAAWNKVMMLDRYDVR
jgi:catalase-peroxidase